MKAPSTHPLFVDALSLLGAYIF